VTHLLPGASVASSHPGTYYPEDYGATANGASHLLSERYGTLAAAQAVYPFVTSLTGWTLDQAAIQKCIDTANAAGGGEVVLNGNYYGIHQPTAMGAWAAKYSLMMRSFVTVCGSGLYTVKYENADAYTLFGTAPMATDWTIRDIRLATDCVGRPPAERVEWAICVENTGPGGVGWGGNKRWRVLNVDFARFPGQRVSAYGPSTRDETLQHTDFEISGCTQRLCQNVSVHVGGCQRGLISNNMWTDSAAGETIILGVDGNTPCERVVVDGNTCFGTIAGQATKDCVVSNNVVKDEQNVAGTACLIRMGGPSSGLGWDGNAGTGSDGLVITGNTLYNVQSNVACMQLYLGSNYTVTDNVLTKGSAGSTGVDVQNNVAGLVIANNVISDPLGSTGNDISAKGTQVVVRGNVCRSAGANAIAATTAPGVAITGNSCVGSIRVEDCDEALVATNRVNSTSVNSISILGATVRALVSDNQIKNSGAGLRGILVSAGTPNYVRGNVINMTGASSPLALQTGASSAGTHYDKNKVVAGSINYQPGDVIEVSGSKTFDFPSVADGAMTSTTVTVTGAVLGMVARVSLNVAVPAGAILSGQVTAADTVTVTLFNKTGGALDLASGTLRADAFV
jgi:hypothetical protein